MAYYTPPKKKKNYSNDEGPLIGLAEVCCGMFLRLMCHCWAVRMVPMAILAMVMVLVSMPMTTMSSGMKQRVVMTVTMIARHYIQKNSRTNFNWQLGSGKGNRVCKATPATWFVYKGSIRAPLRLLLSLYKGSFLEVHG